MRKSHVYKRLGRIYPQIEKHLHAKADEAEAAYFAPAWAARQAYLYA
jgi:hypothetical protein